MPAPRDRPLGRAPLRGPAPLACRPPSRRAGRGGGTFGLRPRVVFLGTPEFAVPSLDTLDELCDAGVVHLIGVVTQPDRRGDRGQVASPPAKVRATRYGVPVLQPERLGDSLDEVLALRPQLLVWAAYGQRIPRPLLDAVRGRAANVHASLLPRWRGAAPAAHAILAGDPHTGVTLMEGTAELDAGPILAQEQTQVGESETAGELTGRLAELGASLLRRELPRYIAGELPRRPQDPTRVTWAPKLAAADGALDFTAPAGELARRVRAMTPEPGAFTTLRGQRLGVLRASVASGPGALPGTFALRGGVPHVAAGEGWLRLDEVRPGGKRAMSGAEWARGLRGTGAALRLPS